VFFLKGEGVVMLAEEKKLVLNQETLWRLTGALCTNFSTRVPTVDTDECTEPDTECNDTCIPICPP
jgi:hypothetical protein